MTAPADYGFLRRPVWLAGIVLALAAIVLFVALGFWQLRRLDEKRAFNELVEDRLAAPTVELDALLAEAGGDPEAIRFRRTRVTGTFAAAEEVLLAGRSYRGQPGYHVLTPFVIDADRAVLVDRGWVPFDIAGPPVPLAPPGRSLTLSGIVDTNRYGRTFGSPGPDGRVTRIGSVDLARLDEQTAADLLPVYVTLDGVAGDTPQPVPVGPAPLGEGPHLAYAVQWVLFAVVVLIGFPVLAYRTARVARRSR